MTDTLKNLLVLAAFIAVLVIGYFMFTQSSESTWSLVKTEQVSPVLLEKTQIFIQRRSELEARTLDTSIFTDPAFTSLRSYATDIPDQPVGRTDIFDEAQPVPTVTPVTIE
jgi:hypothetical protein